jgi:ElaB/YqjD/DUF883 family membrane-anchored ribosome-binding protein
MPTQKNTQSAVDMGADALRKIPEQVGEIAGEYASEARDRAVELADAATERINDLSDQFATTVRERPLLAVGIAAGIGWAIGVLMTKRQMPGQAGNWGRTI